MRFVSVLFFEVYRKVGILRNRKQTDKTSKQCNMKEIKEIRHWKDNNHPQQLNDEKQIKLTLTLAKRYNRGMVYSLSGSNQWSCKISYDSTQQWIVFDVNCCWFPFNFYHNFSSECGRQCCAVFFIIWYNLKVVREFVWISAMDGVLNDGYACFGTDCMTIDYYKSCK